MKEEKEKNKERTIEKNRQLGIKTLKGNTE